MVVLHRDKPLQYFLAHWDCASLLPPQAALSYVPPRPLKYGTSKKGEWGNIVSPKQKICRDGPQA